MIVAGNGIYKTCGECGKLVKINKWCGDLHFCLSPEQLAAKRSYENIVRQQTKGIFSGLGSLGGGIIDWPTQQQPTNNKDADNG